jgi:hypothetical protein
MLRKRPKTFPTLKMLMFPKYIGYSHHSLSFSFTLFLLFYIYTHSLSLTLAHESLKSFRYILRIKVKHNQLYE